MPKPLVYCPTCGTVFESRMFAIEAVQTVQLTGNQEPCINCRRPANVADGLFDGTTNALKIIQAPTLTRALYERFANLIEEAQHKQMQPDEFIKRAEAIHPDFAAAAKQVARSRTVWAAGLLLLLAALKSCSFELKADLNVNQLIEQVVSRGQAASDNRKQFEE